MLLLQSIGRGLAYSVIWGVVFLLFVLILQWAPWLILVFLLAIPGFIGGRTYWLSKRDVEIRPLNPRHVID